MTQREELYAERDIIALDEAGNYYFKHVMAMTSEQLHSKSDIAAELAHRDMLIDKLTKELQAAKAQAVPEWIPVSERLPDDDVLCVVFGEKGVVNNQFKYYKQLHINGYFDSVVDGCALELTEVTHWMPIPAAPEQNK